MKFKHVLLLRLMEMNCKTKRKGNYITDELRFHLCYTGNVLTIAIRWRFSKLRIP